MCNTRHPINDAASLFALFLTCNAMKSLDSFSDGL